MMGYGYGGGFGFFWLIIYAVLLIVPVARILGRIGFNQWWTALAVIPLVNLVFLWILAFIDWPGAEGAPEAGA
ncbi:MAG: hypothetical protein OEL78_05685 [Hyphomicrobiales bacterium]|nr:hypothetical protein [Hyphomicrobiales bacterium]